MNKVSVPITVKCLFLFFLFFSIVLLFFFFFLSVSSQMVTS